MKKIKILFSVWLLSVCVLMALPHSVYAFDINAVEGLSENLAHSNPYVHVSHHEIVEGLVEPGQDFTLRVHVANANPNADANNIMLSYNFLDGVFFDLPPDTTNQHYIPYLAAGETQSIDIPLTVKDFGDNATQTTSLSSVLMEFSFSYQNVDGNAFVNRTALSVMLYQESELSIDAIHLPASATIGQPSQVEVRCVNTGQAPVQNIIVTIDGHFQGSPLVLEHSSLDVGESYMDEAEVIFDETGEQSIHVSVSYETEQGSLVALEEQSQTLQVLDSSVASLADNGQTEVSADSTSDLFSGNNFWFYIVIVSAALVLLIILCLCVHLIRNRKKRG